MIFDPSAPVLVPPKGRKMRAPGGALEHAKRVLRGTPGST